MFYWPAHRCGWVWTSRLPILILMSLMSNFYMWPSDYLMILPAVIQATVWILQEHGVRHAVSFVVLYAAINVLAIGSIYFLFFHGYVWMPFALWICYALLEKQRFPTILMGRT